MLCFDRLVISSQKNIVVTVSHVSNLCRHIRLQMFTTMSVQIVVFWVVVHVVLNEDTVSVERAASIIRAKLEGRGCNQFIWGGLNTFKHVV
jgi:hypothetical protein